MEGGGALAVGPRRARRRGPTRQGGTQVTALSTRREVPAQGTDRRPLFIRRSRQEASVLVPSVKPIMNYKYSRSCNQVDFLGIFAFIFSSSVQFTSCNLLPQFEIIFKLSDFFFQCKSLLSVRSRLRRLF